MIRKLTEKDRSSVLKYLYNESAYNIFIIGDIETFGFDKEWQIIYGEFDEDNNYLSVLLFYTEHSIYYSHNNYYNIKYNEIFANHNYNYISGKEELMNLIKPFIPNFSYKPMYFCKATRLEHEEPLDIKIKTVKTEEDLKKLYKLLVLIDEFGIKTKGEDDFVQSGLKGIQMGTKLYVEENDKIVSTVATTAETTKNAMVVAVATHPNARKKGYASKLMVALMKEYFDNKNKELCLFYDNPKAGKIYKRLGFKDFGKWVMMSSIE